LLPEFGRNTGAVVDIVTKRGANDFHSDLYWFGRYDALGARVADVRTVENSLARTAAERTRRCKGPMVFHACSIGCEGF